MAMVFISHAHSDETLARKVTALLGDALGLSPSNFFLSSQAGRGVAPAESIRASIINELRTVSAVVVLVTPEASARPWVWLEVGNRLGCADKPAPIFVVPSARFVPLLAPVADLRCLELDNDGELHEFVRAVGQCLGKPPLDFLSYTPALEEVVQCSADAYSPWAERWTSLRQHATITMVILLLIAAVFGVFLLGAKSRSILEEELTAMQNKLTATQNESTVSPFDHNAEALDDASRMYRLQGAVASTQGGGPVHQAVVMVSRKEIQEVAACEESDDCTSTTTLTDGTFELNLTKIGAAQGDYVVLSAKSPGFKFFSKKLIVDVRATNAGEAAQTIPLTTQ